MRRQMCTLKQDRKDQQLSRGVPHLYLTIVRKKSKDASYE